MELCLIVTPTECHFLNTTFFNLQLLIYYHRYLRCISPYSFTIDHFLVFLSLWEHGNHLPPKLAITESSRLSFVHVLVAVRDCQVDSITNRAMPCRLSINDHRSSIIDHRSSIIDHRSSIIDHRSSIIDHRSSIIDHRASSIEHRASSIEHRASISSIELWYGTVSNKLWMVST